MLEGTRPVDVIMLVIEFLILFFIVWEFIWKVRDWCRARQDKKDYEHDMTERLTHLTPEEAGALKGLILRGIQPSEIVALAVMNKIYGILVRDFVLGWRIDTDHKDYMTRWAKGKV
jgi:hypothetical protein